MLRCGQSRADSVADKMFVAVDSGEVEEPVARAARGYLESYCVEVVGCTEERCRCIAGAISFSDPSTLLRECCLRQL